MKISIGRLPGVMIQGLLGLIYPCRCHICGRSLDLYSGSVLCKTCYNSIKRGGEEHSNHKPGAYYFDAAYSVCIYEGVIRECVHKFKYNGKLGIEKLFKELMIEFAEKHIDMRRYDWLIPVPLHRVKERQRTFNQSAILTSYLSKRFKIPMLNNNLLRTRMGESQMALSKTKRLEDIKGSFKIRMPALIKGRAVLLIDDVFTTGATVNECSKALKKADVRSVEIFTLARGK